MIARTPEQFSEPAYDWRAPVDLDARRLAEERQDFAPVVWIALYSLDDDVNDSGSGDECLRVALKVRQADNDWRSRLVNGKELVAQLPTRLCEAEEASAGMVPGLRIVRRLLLEQSSAELENAMVESPIFAYEVEAREFTQLEMAGFIVDSDCVDSVSYL